MIVYIFPQLSLFLFFIYQFSVTLILNSLTQSFAIFLRNIPVDGGLSQINFYQLILYNTISDMSESRHKPRDQLSSQDVQAGSDDSQQFQDLQQKEQYFLVIKNIKYQGDDQIIEGQTQNQNQKSLQALKSQEKIKILQKMLTDQSKYLQMLKDKIKSSYLINDNSQKQMNSLKQQINKLKASNSSLQSQNNQLKKYSQKIKLQFQQLNNKICCLHQKLQLEKQKTQTKFKAVEKAIQKITKTETKNLGNDEIIKILISKIDSIQRLFQKIQEARQLIIQKKDQNKPKGPFIDIIEEKIIKVDKIQTIMIKQQNKINFLKQQILKLEEQIGEMHKNKINTNNITTGIGKWFDPVMRFCKIQETKDPQVRQRQTKNTM